MRASFKLYIPSPFRYLNQRFIEDINDLLKGQQGSTVNISQRFEQMEQNYSSLETTNISLQSSLTKLEQKFNSFVENHDSLQQNFTVLQSTNSSLVEKVRLLERNQEEARLELSSAVTHIQDELEAKEKLQSAFKEQQLIRAQVSCQNMVNHTKPHLLSGSRRPVFVRQRCFLRPPISTGGSGEKL